MAKLFGRSLIGFREGNGSAEPLYATDPTTGQRLEPGFMSATAEEVELAVRLAAEAFASYSRTPGRDRGAFLRRIATKIESIAGEIVERAGQETALPPARLQGETARTCAQLRLFAEVAEEGSWVAARIDRAEPDRKPAPRPDIRSMLRPLGPVVVFGASNFPLAFSVAGGDTASALASGNPVIVKAHAAHPGTSELVGQMVRESVRECGLPEGVFSLLFGSGAQIGTALMKHPLVKAGGFTGSRAAGRVLMDLAAARPEPIPFYAEMSSTNPVFILPGALRERGESHCGRTAHFVHPGRRPILHQAGNGLPPARPRSCCVYRQIAATGCGIDAVSPADQDHSFFLRLRTRRAQDRRWRHARCRGPKGGERLPGLP